MASLESMDVDGGSSIASTGEAQHRRLVVYAAATSSSTSGSLSTTYTSYLQSSSSDDGDLALPPPVALSTRLELEEEREKTCRHIKDFTAAGDDEDAAALVLERCFSDVGISWVLSMATDGKSPPGSFIFPRRLSHLARSWMNALNLINLYMFRNFHGLMSNQEEGAFSSVPTSSELTRFVRSTLLKMLPFADAVVSAKVNGACMQHNLSEAMVPAEEKLQVLLGVRYALFKASEHFHIQSHCPSFQESTGMLDQMISLLSGKQAKLDEAVRDTVDEVRTSIMSMNPQTLERSPDIHKATRSTVNCIKVLSTGYHESVRQILLKPGLFMFVSEDKKIIHRFNGDSFHMPITELISCLQENLARLSQPFLDQSLRFLFLLNNTHFMWQELRYPRYCLWLHMPPLTHKIDYHIQTYLKASWIPMVSGLHDPMPLCLGRYSPLAKFESEFQKTYTVQKLWKVPDPELRRRLRKAIIETVIPAFTKYLEDNKITAPRVTQQELEDMLQDLFEG